MELLSRSLKIFLSLPRTTPGVRSLEMAESSQKTTGELWRGSSGVWAAGGANINKENCFFFYFPELNLFGGTFFLLTTHKLIPASCRFTLKHEVACWCKGEQSLLWFPWKQVLCSMGTSSCDGSAKTTAHLYPIGSSGGE